MELKIAVLPGDGIGPEISTQGVLVLDAIAHRFNHKFIFKSGLIGASAIDTVGDPFPEDTLRLCLESDAILFSAVGDPRYDNNPSSPVRPEQGLLKMRKSLELYANIRPINTYKSLVERSPLKEEVIEGVDFVCVRELTGGMYFGEKFESEDKAYDTNVYSRSEIERILRVAYGYAMKRKKHLTVVDKANVLASSRLWRKVAQNMEKEYPEVKTDYMFVDNASMRIVQDPKFFDVLVTENTFGDILTDEASVITGSMGLLPSASTGDKTPLFEPVHGSWPEAAGKNIANPIAQILSAAMLLEHFGLIQEGKVVRDAVQASIENSICTPDIQKKNGNIYTTDEVGEWITDYCLHSN
ncbi:MAG: 3-isopropylmalate dehydrogenase [Muribaculaceae bacterium]|nr:3-isopropylmalate dehydrogenase [Muribaculaceae bacterium]